MRTRPALCVLIIVTGSLLCQAANSAPPTSGTEAVIHSFQPNGVDGLYPTGGLAADASGNLYGTTLGGGVYGYGTVYELSPDGQGGWNLTTLYSFSGYSDGATPEGSVIFDKSGNLYGTASGGNFPYSGGAVFQLVPPASQGGSWTFNVLFNFTAPNDYSPQTGVIFDSAGNLYGTTYGSSIPTNYGTVFELSPPANGSGVWTETILHTFQGGNDGYNPHSRLVMRNGSLYGTASCGGVSACGTVFRVAKNAQGSWFKQTLYAFAGACPNNGQIPEAGMVFDNASNLYGTTRQGGKYGCHNTYPGDGTVFELSPPANPGDPWTETVLFSFNGNDGMMPYADLLMGPGGSLYGTAESGGLYKVGTLFRLTPPATTGNPWSFEVLHHFGSGTGDAQFPLADLLFVNGVLYGTTNGGGSSGYGSVFSWAP